MGVWTLNSGRSAENGCMRSLRKNEIRRKRVWCADCKQLRSTSQFTVCDLNLCDLNFEYALYECIEASGSDSLLRVARHTEVDTSFSTHN